MKTQNRSPKALLLCAGLLLFIATGCRTAAPVDIRPVLATAEGARIHADVFELTSERYGGRATGTEEMMEASRFVRSRFMEAGLRPAVNDTSYFQWYRVDYNEIGTPAHLVATVGDRRIELGLLSDFSPHESSGSGRFDLVPLVVMDSTAFDAGFPGASGRAVLYLPPVQHEADPSMDAFEVRRLPGTHLFEAAQRVAAAGARALLVPGIIYGRIGIRAVEGLPMFTITLPALEMLFETVPVSDQPILLSGEVNATLHRDSPAVNVVGLLPGADRRLADDVVVVGAHTDHVGTIAGIMHPGAHDNASGTAIMIEVAHMFQQAAERGMRPRRSVLFAGFSGEEMALLGSRHYVQEDPLFPLDRTAAMVNLDILGGGNGYMMVGALTFPQYYEFVAGISARYFGHEIRRRDNAPNSDHFYFGLAGVPAAFFYALEGPPVGIHSPTDVPEAMDPDFMAEAARLAFATAWYLANLEPEAAMRLRTTTP
jgi:hypothetical protein